MELLDRVLRVLEICSWVPHPVLVLETYPLHPVLQLVSVAAGVDNFLEFPLFLIVDDDGSWGLFDVPWDGSTVWFYWLKKGYMED
jgi:hypothetical protein